MFLTRAFSFFVKAAEKLSLVNDVVEVGKELAKPVEQVLTKFDIT